MCKICYTKTRFLRILGSPFASFYFIVGLPISFGGSISFLVMVEVAFGVSSNRSPKLWSVASISFFTITSGVGLEVTLSPREETENVGTQFS